jgi:glycosyltransferase involved in cell wall biosynthesis
MGGIGVRYFEMANHLAAAGHRVTLLSPAAPAGTAELGGRGWTASPLDLAALPRTLRQHDVVVAQGQHANDVVLADSGVPAAIDLYDPFLVEHLNYVETLGLDPYRNDHASWVLQMARGDFFLCSSEEQRLYYLGFLTALGRLNPECVADDPEARRLVGVVPFGLPAAIPAPAPYLPPAAAGVRRLLFGALYDWYDPWTLLDALATLDDVDWRLLVIRHRDTASTPQALFAELEARARARGWWGTRIEAIDWVPAERRFDLLGDVEVLVAPHRPTLETALSLRTRFLEALAVGCPVATSGGGSLGRLLVERGAGWVTPPGDAPALAAALREILARGAGRSATIERGRALAREFETGKALAPLLDFVAAPRIEPTKERFSFRPPSLSPKDPLAFRLRRRLRRMLAPTSPERA